VVLCVVCYLYVLGLWDVVVFDDGWLVLVIDLFDGGMLVVVVVACGWLCLGEVVIVVVLFVCVFVVLYV